MPIFSDKIRKVAEYPNIRIVEGKPYEGVDTVFFTRHGGVSEDQYQEEKLVGADAHPIVIKARKKDGSPVAGVVVGSHHGLLKGVLNKTMKKMIREFDIDPSSIEVEIGPGLGPASIQGIDREEAARMFSSTSYEVGLSIAQNYLENKADAGYISEEETYFRPEEFKYCNPGEVGYFGVDASSAVAENQDIRAPIFRPHPANQASCVIDIEALVKQTVAIPMSVRTKEREEVYFPGVQEDRISAAGKDTIKEVSDFFSARRQQQTLDKEAVAALEGGSLTGPGALKSLPLYNHIGRQLYLVKVMDSIGQGKGR